MADTYTLISSVTVGAGGASSIDFTSIPATYTDLCLKVSARSDGTGSGGYDILANFNGVTTNRSYRLLYNGGSTPAAGSQSGSTGVVAPMVNASYTANTFGNAELYIPNYAGSNYKSISSDGVQENNATLVYNYLVASLWSSTSAITSISLTSSTGTIQQYSTAYLYGIKNS